MIKKIIDFFTITDEKIWQHVFLVSIIIPFVIVAFEKIKNWYVYSRPINTLLRGYRKSEVEILLYVSQLSPAMGTAPNLQKDLGQQYLISYPDPLPTNRQNISYALRQNIDPVWAEADGRCAADVFNILGRINKFNNLRIADIIKDWDKRDNPLFTIGFTPKTMDLLDECKFLNFSGFDQGHLKIEGHDLQLDSTLPHDAGIVQKTFNKKTSKPVFILAGLGTTGTEVASYFLSQNCVALGKLFGNKGFCVLLKADIRKGRNYFETKAIYPRPSLWRSILYPMTFYKWNRERIFPLIQ